MICNIGYYTVNRKDENGNLKQSFKIWEGMIARCYSKYVRDNYKNCKVCEEWLCYDNFEKWYDENYYSLPNEVVSLDKDLLQCDNNIKIYSPNTCIFVPQRLNSLFITLNKSQTIEKFKEIKQMMAQNYTLKIPIKTYLIILQYCNKRINEKKGDI